MTDPNGSTSDRSKARETRRPTAAGGVRLAPHPVGNVGPPALLRLCGIPISAKPLVMGKAQQVADVLKGQSPGPRTKVGSLILQLHQDLQLARLCFHPLGRF
jgi:hypothetical protein